MSVLEGAQLFFENVTPIEIKIDLVSCKYFHSHCGTLSQFKICRACKKRLKIEKRLLNLDKAFSGQELRERREAKRRSRGGRK